MKYQYSARNNVAYCVDTACIRANRHKRVAVTDVRQHEIWHRSHPEALRVQARALVDEVAALALPWHRQSVKVRDMIRAQEIEAILAEKRCPRCLANNALIEYLDGDDSCMFCGHVVIEVAEEILDTLERAARSGGGMRRVSPMRHGKML